MVELACDGHVPDCVVRWVHGDDILGQVEHALRCFLFCYDGSEVGHSLAVRFRIKNRSERLSLSIILRQRLDVCPRSQFCVLPHGFQVFVSLISRSIRLFTLQLVSTKRFLKVFVGI
jgi:hypothetical protein